MDELLRQKIESHSGGLWDPGGLTKWSLDTHSWFDINKGKNNKPIDENEYTYDTIELQRATYKCIKKIIIPTKFQKEVLLSWMDTYIRMYNETLKCLKGKTYNNERFTLISGKVRTEYMKNKKEEILNNSGLKNNRKPTKIYSHILDEAIKDVCTSFKSAFTNLRNKNIKHFRVRYMKISKKQKILKIEKLAFSKNNKTFCGHVLGDEIQTNDGSDFSDVGQSGGTLTYNYKSNRFTLLIPQEIRQQELEEPKKYSVISLDPGIRTFMSGYANGSTLEIGNKLKETIKPILRTIDKINANNKLTQKKKRKAENKRYIRIGNLVDDLHWKSIKYLTKNYNTILIGNMSTYSIVSNNKSNKLDKMTKRLALIMRLYVFKERLKFKCGMHNCDFGEINERYTSQMCSYCGNRKTNLGSNKIYDCTECHKVIGRDTNGARNIYLMGIK